ncbi:hypothetical protein [Pseudohongiella spirulinae]|uniref:Uncharacterized protein n=1 Tax=Pseudohongiella spirulinae TaxID=1249552 RepID=A0A0S2KAB9_9GAMM|nr:hypothetical protein [Pseudohongiella spirulinae]ALO45297.1 hypothetical protein PS2015_614 [Pseudohongiella spirulinae]
MFTARSIRKSVAYTSLLGLMFFTPISAVSAQGEERVLPRTPDGKPDLQGLWTNATQTPLERPAALADQAVLTPEQASELEFNARMRIENANQPSDPNRPPPTDGNTDLGYNNFWVDRGTGVAMINGQYRTSLIVDPANGRIPYVEEPRPRGQAAEWRARPGVQAYDGPELRPLGERCLLSFGSSSGPPMLPVMYNNNYQIVQTDDHVMILVEMVHDARIIPLNRDHTAHDTQTWMGQSVGRWEGDTLVVETRHFHPQQTFRGSSENLRVTERFSLESPDKIIYSVTLEDPTVFAQPWTAEIPMNRRPAGDMMYEYACHEGNYAFSGILAGARMLEQLEDQREVDAALEGEGGN